MLTAVDVVCRTRQRGVTHDVNGKCGDIDRADDTPDRQGRPQLFATPVKVFAEQGRREWRIDEAGDDQVDAVQARARLAMRAGPSLLRQSPGLAAGNARQCRP